MCDQSPTDYAAAITVGAVSNMPLSVQGQRRTLLVLATATAIGASGLAAGGTAGALLGSELMSSGAVGLPLGLLVIGSAAAAPLIARESARAGRPRGLALGYFAGVVGAIIVIVSASTDNVAALLVGSTLLGAANAAIFLSRYAAAELGGARARGRALGVVLAATAIGAIISPNLLGPSGELADALGLPELSGLYLVAIVAFAVAAVLLLLIPSPRSQRGIDTAVGAGGGTLRRLTAGLAVREVRIALIVLAASNLIMVAVMAVAPVHMKDHGEALSVIGVVISIHVAGMFVPSPLTGWLADHAGSATVAMMVSACWSSPGS